MRETLKTLARIAALAAVSPLLLSFYLRRMILGANRAITGSTQLLALLPGLPGQYLRRAFLSRALDGGCHSSATIEFGTLFSEAGSRIDANVYIGPMCHVGLVHLERDVLVGASVHIPSGGATHGIADLDRPIRDQDGRRTMIHVGAGSWIGSAAIILADVGRETVVGAGSVVTRPVPPMVIAGGIPARVLRHRAESA